MLPNLIVIGAGKSGTTSLHYYLDQHPDIYMSRVKDPFLFQRANWQQRLDWYESLFPEPAPVRGEASPSYSAYPAYPDVARRIHDTIPEARLIYVVRDPIDRMVAQYSQHLADGKEDRELDEAMRGTIVDEDDRDNPYLCMSRYATQVEQYLEHFDPERLHVIDQVDLGERRAETMRGAFEFLDVDPAFTSPRFEEVVNTQRDQVRFSSAGARLRDTRLARFVHQRVPRRVRGPVTKPLTRVFARRVERPELSPETRSELERILAPEAERLRELTGKRFASWSV